MHQGGNINELNVANLFAEDNLSTAASMAPGLTERQYNS